MSDYRPKPLVLAMVTCQQIIHDTSGMNSLINVFDHVSSATFPVFYPACGVYCKLSDVTDGTEFKLQFVDTIENTVLFEAKIPNVAVANPRDPTEVVFNVQMLGLPHAGRFEFRLFADGSFLSMSVLTAKPVTVP